MKNKVLVELVIPEIDEVYNLYLPAQKKIGNIVELLRKAVFELSNGLYQTKNQAALYSGVSGERYSMNQFLYQTDIRNGSRIILL